MCHSSVLAGNKPLRNICADSSIRDPASGCICSSDRCRHQTLHRQNYTTFPGYNRQDRTNIAVLVATFVAAPVIDTGGARFWNYATTYASFTAIGS